MSYQLYYIIHFQITSGYVTEIGHMMVQWSGFSDPHSEIDDYKVSLGSKPSFNDILPIISVGTQTSKFT